MSTLPLKGHTTSSGADVCVWTFPRTYLYCAADLLRIICDGSVQRVRGEFARSLATGRRTGAGSRLGQQDSFSPVRV
jgi:hypothetical protein